MPKGIYTKKKEHIEKIRRAHIGKKLSDETKKKISLIMIGKNAKEKSHWWKGGVTPVHKQIRMSFEYKLWRESVFKRDNYTCIWCGATKCEIQADHIKPFAYFPELRFAIDNGRTLCRKCHLTTETFGNRNKNKANKK